jgi:hypothetical protein
MKQANEHRIELSGYDSLCSANPTYRFSFLRVSLRICVIKLILQTALANSFAPELAFVVR